MISKKPQYYDWQQKTAINNSSEQLRDDMIFYIRDVINYDLKLLKNFWYVIIPYHNTSDDLFRSMILNLGI